MGGAVPGKELVLDEAEGVELVVDEISKWRISKI